jgi:DNA-binding winged helix-turn-helix (wHTH) protein
MSTASQFGFDVYRLDVANEQLWCGEQVLPLTAKALRVLGLLVAHAGQLVSKDTLFEAVWPEAAVSDGVLTNCIGELRRALGDTAQTPRFIQTVHRRGYRFLAPVTVLAPPAEPPCGWCGASVWPSMWRGKPICRCSTPWGGRRGRADS